jgi:dehydrogenase/reductase SDR family protein 7B
MRFKNTVIWITGASSGIGAAMAVELSRKGASLILSARRKDELEKVAERCTPDSVHILPLDLAESESFSTKVEQAIAFFGRIDILLNNGGISQRALAAEASLESLRRIMDVNFFGTTALTQALLPHFKSRKSGYIVVISSVMGKFGTKFRSGYAASKHALHGWFDCLRQEMYEYNIDVTLVCPGYVKTEITVNSLTADGRKYGLMGEAQSKAMSPEQFANKLIPKLEKRPDEVYIGGKEIMAVYLKRWFPKLLNRILKNAKVT